MNLKTLSLKAAGGLFAVGIVATSLIGGTRTASADTCPSPPCIAIQTPGGIVSLLRPDLTVTELKADKVVDTLIIQLKIKNIGATTNKTFRTDVLVDGVVVQQYVEDGLIGGNARYYTFSIPAPAGSKHNVTVVTDAGAQLPEKLESNNTMQLVITD